MIFLVFAIVCSSSMGIVMHYAEEKECNMKMVTLVNYVCSILLCFAFQKEKQILPNNGEMRLVFYLGLINGALFLGTLLLYQLNIRKNGTPLTVSFSHLGVLVPTILSIVVFGDVPGAGQWIGVVIAILAILVINYEKGGGHELGFKLGLILQFISGGCADMMSKVFESVGNVKYDNLFLLYTFSVAGVLCLIWVVSTKAFATGKKEVGFGIALGVFNYVGTMLLLQAIIALPAFLVYPVYSVGVIVFINIVNLFLLKEKLSKRQIAGMVLISIALVFLNQ